MKKIDLLIQEFETLNAEEQSLISGGFVSVNSLEESGSPDDTKKDINCFQCACNNNCSPKGPT